MSDTSGAPALASTEKLEIPEVSMGWRRAFTIGTVIVAAVGLAVIILRLTDPHALRDIAIGLIVVIVIQSAFYMAAATTADLAGIAAGLNVKRILNIGGGA